MVVLSMICMLDGTSSNYNTLIMYGVWFEVRTNPVFVGQMNDHAA